MIMAAPEWIETGANVTAGLDLVALRASTMRIGYDLLDGITTVTPSVRYFSFVSWITYRFWARGGEDSDSAYLDFARRLEAAIVLGNLVSAPPGTPIASGLIGAEIDQQLGDGADLSLDIQVQALGTRVYGGPLIQLGLLVSKPDGAVPRLSESRGLPLAKAVEKAVGATALGRRLAGEVLPLTASREELAEFGALLRVNVFPPEEKAILLGALLPQAPVSPMERRRLSSYGAFLACAAGGQPKAEFRRMLTEAVQRDRALPSVLTPILDGWARYLVRDLLAVVHECALEATLKALPPNAKDRNQAPQYLHPDEVIARTLEDGNDSAQMALLDLGLIEKGESWAALPFSLLDQRIHLRTSDRDYIANGIRFWAGGLQEPDLLRVAEQTGLASPALLPVAWLLAERRVGPGVLAMLPDFRALSHEGPWRLGLEQRVFPTLSRFREQGVTFGEAAAELTFVTVEQHLHTAWDRLANNGNDVAVLHSDGHSWAHRKSFSAGHMDSRLNQVRNWVQQLGLLTEGGLTQEGELVLQEIITTLGREVS